MVVVAPLTVGAAVVPPVVVIVSTVTSGVVVESEAIPGLLHIFSLNQLERK